jgi:hypothetical protein
MSKPFITITDGSNPVQDKWEFNQLRADGCVETLSSDGTRRVSSPARGAATLYPPNPTLPPAEYDAALDEFQRRKADIREADMEDDDED